MIRRITLLNYMSHTETVIEPAAGLTVLIGPNNCGKSAVVSALETLCGNVSGSYMVRHDEREAKVTIETDDGHIFVWKRRNNKVSYTIDGTEVHRLGKGEVPEDLHRLLRLPKVDAGENADPFDIHFGTQKSPIFLLNEPESRAALFFASSSDAAILLEMQKRHRSKVRERKTDERRLTTEIEKLDLRLAVLEPLQMLAAEVKIADDQFGNLKESGNRISDLQFEIQTLDAVRLVHDSVERRNLCLVALKQTPQMADTDSLGLQIVDLLEREQLNREEQDRALALSGLASPPMLEDEIALADSIRLHAIERMRFSRWSTNAIIFNDLRQPPLIRDVGTLGEIYQRVSFAERRHWHIVDQTNCLGQLAELPTLAEIEDLELLANSLATESEILSRWSANSAVHNILRQPPAIRDLGSLNEIYLKVTFAESLHTKLMRQAECLDRLTEPPILSEIGDLERTLHSYVAAELTTEKYLKRQSLFAHLTSPPNLSDLLPRESLALAIEMASSDVAEFEKVRSIAKAGMQECEMELHAAEGLRLRAEESAPVSRRTSSVVFLSTFSVVAAIFVTVAFIFGPRWFSAREDQPPDQAKVNPALLAKANDRPETPIPPKSEKKLPDGGQTISDNAKKPETNEPKKTEPMKETTSDERKRRVKLVIQVLKDSDEAGAKGRYLEAALGYGQAAILYPEELAEAEKPERVREKFMGALSLYQAEVERALMKASERKPGEKK